MSAVNPPTLVDANPPQPNLLKPRAPRPPRPKNSVPLGERLITLLIQMAGYLSILFVSMICLFLLKEGLPTVFDVPLTSLLGKIWYPIEGYFGIIPLLLGSLMITVAAVAIALPFGVAAAVFMSEVAPSWVSEILKPLVEILAGFPSVVLGFIGILVLSPALREFLHLPTGLTAFTGAAAAGLGRYPDHRIRVGRCPALCAALLPRGLARPGGDPLADHLGGDPACRAQRCADRDHAGHRARDR